MKKHNAEQRKRWELSWKLEEKIMLSFFNPDLPVDVKFLLAGVRVDDLDACGGERMYSSEFNLQAIDILLKGTEVSAEWEKQKEILLNRETLIAEGKYDYSDEDLWDFRKSLHKKTDLDKIREYIDSL